MSTEGLIGRDAELAQLQALIDNIEEEGASLVVRGQPGVGKSSILRAAAAMARRRRAMVLESSGIESEAMLPFAGLHQLLRPLVPSAVALPTVQRNALATALGSQGGPPPEFFLTALAALTLVVDAAGEQPVVLVVDDVQWLDTPSADVLAFVARRLRHDAVVMISAVRDGHDVAIGSPDDLEMNLQGLDAKSSRQLLTSVADDLPGDSRRAVLNHAQGNPLALVELPAAWRSAAADPTGSASAPATLTARLEQAFAARISDLPDITRDALLVAAVNTVENLAEVLAGATLLSGVAVRTEHLEPAASARLVAFDQVHIRFRHPLVRSGVLFREPVGRRQAAHAAMSEVLSADPYRQVWHQAQSVDGPDDVVADRLERSHVESMRRGSVLSAIAALERSAQLTAAPGTRARRLLLAAQLAFGVGRASLVGRLLDAAERNELCEADRARAEWLRELFTEGRLGDSERIQELCRLAARSATSGDAELALDLLGSAALRCWWAVGDRADAEQVVRVAKNLTALQDDSRCISAIAVADPLGQVPQTLRRLDAMAARGVSDVDQLRQLGMAARAVGAEVQAGDYFRVAESSLRERGQLGLLSHVLPIQAAVYIDLGEWPRARQSLDEGRLLSEETGQTTWRVGTAAVAAVLSGVTGNVELALRQADEIETECAGQPAGDFRSLAQLARGAAHLSAGRPAEASAALRPVFDPAQPCHHPRQQLSALMFLVEAALGCGVEDSVRDLVAGFEELARRTPSPILRIHLIYARPMLADVGAAEELFRQALAHDLTRWPWPRSRIELGYGNWLRRRRRMVDARTPLRAALATFDAIGAEGWARQARIALRACGERTAGPDAVSPATTMTAQEMQIARLAAEGLSNREIGQQLYLSPRTVGSHLYRIFPKLGVTARAQLASRIASADASR